MEYPYCLIPITIYIVIIASAYVKSRRSAPPTKLYHTTLATAIDNILATKKFTTYTEGVAFFSSNKNTKNLGKDSIAIKNILINIKKCKKEKVKLLSFLKKNGLFGHLKNNDDLKTLTVSGNAISEFKNIFEPKAKNIFNIWGAGKSLTNQWVTIQQGDLIFTQINETNEITELKIKVKTGKADCLAKWQKRGMLVLNAVIATGVLIITLLAFSLTFPWLNLIYLCLLLATLITILLWAAFNKRIYECVNK